MSRQEYYQTSSIASLLDGWVTDAGIDRKFIKFAFKNSFWFNRRTLFIITNHPAILIGLGGARWNKYKALLKQQGVKRIRILEAYSTMRDDEFLYPEDFNNTPSRTGFEYGQCITIQ